MTLLRQNEPSIRDGYDRVLRSLRQRFYESERLLTIGKPKPRPMNDACRRSSSFVICLERFVVAVCSDGELLTLYQSIIVSPLVFH
jgi:hypothetical protein